MRALRRSALLLSLVLPALFALLAGGSSAAPAPAGGRLVEVVVTLPRPPLALAVAHDRTLAAAVRRTHSLDVAAPAAVSYLRSLAAAQQEFSARLAVHVPEARVNWHYAVALDGVSVVLPAADLPRLSAVPGATVWPTVTYRSLGTRSSSGAQNRPPGLIGATSIWGSDLSTAGQGMKIGIIDDGVDQAHPYFDPSGFSYPAGFPKGNTAYTTPKVIVARAFPSPSSHWKYQSAPFDPVDSDHATHVAGIAAGDYDTPTPVAGNSQISGIAPKAYIGNYKALTVPTRDYGLDGNSPEIAKAIDQAVADGMNVINLSIGEPEVAPERDIVVQALDAAAAAGVVPVVAAGNDFTIAGDGSVGSPGNAPAAISVAASTGGAWGTAADRIAWFSSAGPTPVSLLPKPDVTAPGVGVLSSVPPKLWQAWDGTSMATPVVAAAAALLMQRHPTWTVEEVKSALASTGDPVLSGAHGSEVSTLREGGGRIDLARADQPLIFTDPSSIGFGLVERGWARTASLVTTDAGGGADPWTVSVAQQSMPAGVTLVPQESTVVAGATLPVELTVTPKAKAGDGTGFVVLTRGSDIRRVPFWFHVEVPRLQLDPHKTLSAPGLYRGDTAGQASRVSTYRYPERGLAPGVPTHLGGPEQVFQFTLDKPVANFGVAVVSHAPGVTVSPRLVRDDDENRVVGYTGIPSSLNPYQGLYTAEPVVGAVLAAPGTYDVVFDTPTGAKPGHFRFRFWIDDTTPPSIAVLGRTVVAGRPIRVAVRDSGSGVDPRSLRVSLDGGSASFRYANGILSIPATSTLAAGRHLLTVIASDYQEAKNMEDVGPVLPNTRVLHAFVRIRR
ncbi:MAG TPA: S8 family serine peptidase [Gaiellaceae bacterium]|nr:S8 family serine peptidase [Gaiellaceae bacterium]